jgi:RNA polymerase sigma-70 factor (ECF subfamily)
MKVHERILHNFLGAVSAGRMEDLIRLLKEDILLFTDGGGSVLAFQNQRITSFPKPIEGQENVSRLILTIVPKFRESTPNYRQETTLVNGMPAIVSYSGDEPRSLVALEIEGEQIRNIYVQSNPEKLKHLKKQ